MSDRLWMHALSDEQRRALVWKCIFCGADGNDHKARCNAPDGDGHMFDPVKPVSEQPIPTKGNDDTDKGEGA